MVFLSELMCTRTILALRSAVWWLTIIGLHCHADILTGEV